MVPDNTIDRDDGWKAFRIVGVLDFSLIGILAKISRILATNEIGIFAVSTYNTDYILTKEENFNKSIREIYDFLQSAEINKRSSLRGKNIEIEDAGILSYRSINHDDLYSWKQTINTYKRYR
jgi:hypothetical protein